MTDGMTVISPSVILQHETSAARDRLSQIELNQKLLCEFEKVVKISNSH
jgi:hypothetical protein